MCELTDSSCGTLEYESVVKLKSILEDTVVIDSAVPQYCPVSLRPIDLVLAVREQWSAKDPALHEIRLNGSAATCVVSANLEGAARVDYNDLDLIFRVDIETHSDFERVREIAMSAFLLAAKRRGAEMLPEHPFQVEECYVRNMMKIWTSSDRWSLISFRNRSGGPDIELKFVSVCKRPYQFSIDSFQLVLDSYLSIRDQLTDSLSPRFFPTVVVHSMWGNYLEAVCHVRDRLIDTENPASIYGGGLLKYCHLLTVGYRPAPTFDREKMESIMCTRFFIDFPDSAAVQKRILKYVSSHFSILSPSALYFSMGNAMNAHMIMASLTTCFLSNLLYVVHQSSHCCLTMQDRQDRLSCLECLLRPQVDRTLLARGVRRNPGQHWLRPRGHPCPPTSVRRHRARTPLHPTPHTVPLVSSECA